MRPKRRKQPQAAALGKAIQCVVLGLIVLSVIASLVADAAFGSRIHLSGWLIIFAIVLSFLTSAILQYRAWARIRAAEFLFCPVCEYSLRGLPEQGRCPECGGEFDREMSREHWKKMFNREVTIEGVLQLSDRHMRQYVWASTALILCAAVLFSVDLVVEFSDLRLVSVFELGPIVLLVFQFLLGTRVGRRLFWKRM